ncbi:MAG: DUF5011 domain-containing protein [Bacilli bacterium]|nr:DUF5011 domain-containing protein [Bacilli bacterium]
MSNYTTAKVVGFITIIVILFVLIFITFKLVNINKAKQKELDSYLVYNKEVIDASINGDFLEYIELNDIYEEDGVFAFYKDEDISHNVITSYFSKGEQVSYIDTSRPGSYLVKYTIVGGKKTRIIYKTVMVIDSKKPVIVFPRKTVISLDEVKTFDLKKDVTVKDNSEKVKFSYDNTLESKPGKYVITYTAIDGSNNKQVKKRIIEVK